jgi:hypothetical protein
MSHPMGRYGLSQCLHARRLHYSTSVSSRNRSATAAFEDESVFRFSPILELSQVYNQPLWHQNRSGFGSFAGNREPTAANILPSQAQRLGNADAGDIQSAQERLITPFASFLDQVDLSWLLRSSALGSLKISPTTRA